MNREQKAAAVAEIAESIKEADAVFAVDYRGISVPQAAELRTRLRDVDATFRVVKNSLTERAVDEGHTILVLSDRKHDAKLAPIPSLLATSAVHHHLIRAGKRTRCGIVVESVK
jgi:ribosomal protein L10